MRAEKSALSLFMFHGMDCEGLILTGMSGGRQCLPKWTGLGGGRQRNAPNGKKKEGTGIGTLPK